MQTIDDEAMTVEGAIIQALAMVTKRALPSFAQGEDVFATLGLNSLQIFSTIVKLEDMLDIAIGEDPEDFERIRSFDGLKELLRGKLEQRMAGERIA